jgi:hypothetical protein
MPLPENKTEKGERRSDAQKSDEQKKAQKQQIEERAHHLSIASLRTRRARAAIRFRTADISGGQRVSFGNATEGSIGWRRRPLQRNAGSALRAGDEAES